jgi:hypothetical protein
LRQMVILLQNGVPYDVIMKMSDVRRVAMVVAIGELKGGRYNWETSAWEKPE